MRPGARGSRPKILLALILVVFIAGAAAYGVASGSFLVSGPVSGAEGDQGSALGFQPPGTNTIYQVGDNSMANYVTPPSDGCTYSWASGSGSENGGVFRTCSGGASEMSYQMSTPQTFCGNSEYSGLQINGCYVSSFSYWSGTPGNSQHVVANIYEDNWTIEFKGEQTASSLFGPTYDFGNAALWLNNYINVWNVQSCDPTNMSTCQNGYVWGAPLQGTVNAYSDNCVNSSCANNISPEDPGSALSLYYGVSSNNQAPVGNGLPLPYNPQTIQQYLQNGGSPYSPDQSMNQYAQTPINFNGFGPYFGGFVGTSVESVRVTISITMYFIVIGSFLWTNPNHTPWHPINPPSQVDYLGNFANGIGNFVKTIAYGLLNLAQTSLYLYAVVIIAVSAIVAASFVIIMSRRNGRR